MVSESEIGLDDEGLARVSALLADEFQGVHSTTVIEESVRQAHAAVARSAAFPDYLPLLVHRTARAHLRGMSL